MFLTSGPHGPFYKLHSFRATDALDTEHIKNLKIAGTLRYEVRYTVPTVCSQFRACRTRNYKCSLVT